MKPRGIKEGAPCAADSPFTVYTEARTGITNPTVWNIKSVSIGYEQRDRLAATAAINAEIAVQRPDRAVRMDFSFAEIVQVFAIGG